MSFLSSSFEITTSVTTLYQSPVDKESNVHTLILLNPATSGSIEVTLQYYNNVSAGTTQFKKVTLTSGESWELPKTINFQPGDRLEAFTDTGTVNALISNFLDDTSLADPISFTIQGEWSSSVTYPQYALVYYNGNTYVNTLESNVNNIPPSSGWIQMVQGFYYYGVWDIAETYPILAVVEHNGSIWFAGDGAIAGEEPGISTNWSSLIQFSSATIDDTSNVGGATVLASLNALDNRIDTLSTTDVTEGTNLYYTQTRVNADIDARVDKSFVDALNVDADTLDGIDSADFARTDTSQIFQQDITVNGTINGDLSGNVTGDLSGNISGNVYASNTTTLILNSGDGTVSASYTGNVTGDVTGDLTGNVTGDVTGNVTGDLTGNVTGDVTGNVTGDVTGNVTGNVTGDLLGDIYATDGVTKILETGDGVSLAEFTGNIIGNITGNVLGDIKGDLVGDIYAADETTRILDAGDGVTIPATLTGNVVGNIISAGTSSFDNIVVDGGAINGTVIGGVTPGLITGTTISATQFSGPLTGSVTGNITSTGVSTFDNILVNGGNIDGATIGSNTAANITGLLITANSGFIGDVTGNVTGEVTGNVTGNVTGAVTGNVTGNITSTGVSEFDNILVNGGNIDGATIGSNTAANITGLLITANSGFIGDVTGNVTGNVDGNVTGNVTGAVTGNVTGNITSSGISTFDDIRVNNGSINGAVIGATTAADITGTNITANNGFTGDLTGNVLGDVIGDLTGDVTGNITSTGVSSFSNIDINGGTINTTVIGDTSPNLITGTTIEATSSFEGDLNGNVTGNITGNLIGNVYGDIYATDQTTKILETGDGTSPSLLTSDVTGNLTGDVTSSGTSNFNNLNVSGNLNFTSLNVSNNASIGNDLTVDGILTVNGTTTVLNTQSIELSGSNILLNATVTGTPSQTAGLEIERGTETNKTLFWNETSERWTIGSETFVAGSVIADLTGDVTSTGTSAFSTVTIDGGTIDGTVIGGTTPRAITATTVIATSFTGDLTGTVTGDIISSGTSTFNNVSISGGGTIAGNVTGVLYGNVYASDEANQVIETNNGKVYFTSTDQKGDFKIGPELTIERASGTITGEAFDRSLFAVLTPYILSLQ